MTEKRVVILAIDPTDFAENAFDCKCIYKFIVK